MDDGTGSATTVSRVVSVVDDDADHWRIPRPVAWVLLVAPIPVMAAMAAVAVADSGLYHALIDEDGPIEWTQFFLISGAVVGFAWAAVEARRTGRRGLTVLYVLLAAGFFVVAGEEISWGQRILGFATPEVLEPINHQGESNIHNILGFERLFNAAEALGGLYGFLVPIAWLSERVRSRVGRWLDPMLVPPLCLVAAFLLPFAYRAARVFVLPHAGERLVELGEVAELAFYLGLVTVGLVSARALRRMGREQAGSSPSAAGSLPS